MHLAPAGVVPAAPREGEMMTFTEEYVRGLADRHGWGWLPMDQVTLRFGSEQTVFLLPLGTGATTAQAWVDGQVSRGLDDEERAGVSALVHTVNAACPELTRDGRYYGDGELFTVPPLVRECDVCTEPATDQHPDGEVLCEGHARMRLAALPGRHSTRPTCAYRDCERVSVARMRGGLVCGVHYMVTS